MPQIGRPRCDLTGQRFGRLVAVRHLGCRNKCTIWSCRCDCGVETETDAANLKSGHTKSCGCLIREVSGARFRTHGEGSRPAETAEHRIWAAMLARCRNPNTAAYKDYGARGITVCERWLTYENFLADMGRRPSKHTLERRDNSRGYGPDNCVWATRAAQARNYRRNVRVTYCGQEMVLIDAAAAAGLPYKTVHSRIRKLGWSVDDALSRPLAA